MEWTWLVATTIPVLTFIGGLWWNRVDGDRRETRARQAAATEAFEQLQRDTHLKLQDSLAATYNAASKAAAARTSGPDSQADVDAYRTATNHAAVLLSRLADTEVQTQAREAIQAAQALFSATETGIDAARAKAADALETAINALGLLVRSPPSERT
jgi:hypothetical protein